MWKESANSALTPQLNKRQSSMQASVTWMKKAKNFESCRAPKLLPRQQRYSVLQAKPKVANSKSLVNSSNHWHRPQLVATMTPPRTASLAWAISQVHWQNNWWRSTISASRRTLTPQKPTKAIPKTNFQRSTESIAQPSTPETEGAKAT